MSTSKDYSRSYKRPYNDHHRSKRRYSGSPIEIHDDDDDGPADFNSKIKNSKKLQSETNHNNEQPDQTTSDLIMNNMVYQSGNMHKNDGSDKLNTIMMNNMMYQSNTIAGNSMINAPMYDMIMNENMMPTIMTGSLDMMNQSGLIQTPSSMEMAMTPQVLNTGNGMDMGVMIDPMMMDPSMMAMYQAPVEKKEIILRYSKLSPPKPNRPPPTQREKPQGCRTIFVGGLPDLATERTVREIFECYGTILTLRMSRKKFCHIRFGDMSSVDAAIALSGYFIRVFDQSDLDKDDNNNTNSGWLHIDYAQSRDDENDYIRLQRQMYRAQQAGLDMLKNDQIPTSRRRSPSPIPAPIFSHVTMVQLMEKIKSDEQLGDSLSTLKVWLEKGECSKKNVFHFYSMIQATNSHVRKLMIEKTQTEEELAECTERVKQKLESIFSSLEQVENVFQAATHKRVWDHFTKPQRKNIENWLKSAQMVHKYQQEYNEKFLADDVKMHQDDNCNEDLQELKRENESLVCQLEAYKNEVEVMKSEAKTELERFKAQYLATQAMKMIENKTIELPQMVKPNISTIDTIAKDEQKTVECKSVEAGEAKLIAIMSAFLQVHPQGASLDYIVSYMRALLPSVSQIKVHDVLQKHEDVFECHTKGVGANIEKRWHFAAFKADMEINES